MPSDRISYSYTRKLYTVELEKSLTRISHESRFFPLLPEISDQLVVLWFLSPLIIAPLCARLTLCGKRQRGGHVHQENSYHQVNVFFSQMTQ